MRKMEHFEKVLGPLSELCDKLQVHLDITITAGTPMKSVFTKEALKIRPTHVILDRNLRKDKLYYKEHLYCEIIVFSRCNQVEHLHGSNGGLTPDNSLELPVKVAPTTPVRGSSLYPPASPVFSFGYQIEGSNRPSLAGRSSKGELETPMFSPGPELRRSTSSSSKSSENFFIDLCMLDSSEGVVPVWSFGDPETGKKSPTSAHTSSCKVSSSNTNQASLASSFDKVRATSPTKASKDEVVLVDKFIEPKRQLPLLKELFDCPEYEIIQGSDAVEEAERPDLHNSSFLCIEEARKDEKLIAEADEDASESIVFDVAKQHENHVTFSQLDTAKTSIMQRDCILGKNFVQPPPLCSVCKLQSPDFGRSPTIYRADEMKAATNNFAAANLIAEGGFGFVYKGILQEQFVAIKKLKSSSLEGDTQFSAEVEALSYAQHMNLVRLVGFCVDANEYALVYEYVCNGSLDRHLSGGNGCNLKWPSRFKIALGAARGLRYLHEECRVGCIVHRDMRPSNILVTHDFTAMVGDFGLAKIISAGEGRDRTRAIGTLGYAAPEYIESNEATPKTDVYSYGVVLLELITGRRAVDLLRSKGEIFLTEWARSRLESSQIDGLVDQNIAHSLDKHELGRMVKAATLCITKNPKNRPGMSQIIRILEGDFDNMEHGMLQLNHTIKPIFDNQDSKCQEAIEEMDKMKLPQSIVRAISTASKKVSNVGAVHRNWRSYVKPK